MREWREVELARLTPASNFDVVALILADWNRRIGEVRDVEQEIVELALNLGEALLAQLDLIADLTHLGDERRWLLFRLRDVLGDAVSPCSQGLHVHQQLSALVVERENLVDRRRRMAIGEHPSNSIGVLANHPCVNHPDPLLTG